MKNRWTAVAVIGLIAILIMSLGAIAVFAQDDDPAPDDTTKPALPFDRDGYHGGAHGRFHGRGGCEGAKGANEEAMAEDVIVEETATEDSVVEGAIAEEQAMGGFVEEGERPLEVHPHEEEGRHPSDGMVDGDRGPTHRDGVEEGHRHQTGVPQVRDPAQLGSERGSRSPVGSESIAAFEGWELVDGGSQPAGHGGDEVVVGGLVTGLGHPLILHNQMQVTQPV